MKQECNGQIETFGRIQIPSDFKVGQSVSHKDVVGQITRIRGTFVLTEDTGEAGLEVEISPNDGSPAFWTHESHVELYGHTVGVSNIQS